MDVLDIERGGGRREKVTLRRFVRRDHAFSTPEHVTREFEILRLVESAGIPAPRPILLDAKGEYFGAPAIVMSHFSGRPLFPTTNIPRWTEGLARVLLTVHAVTPDRFDLSWLNVCLLEAMRERINEWRDEAQGDPLAREMLGALDSELDRIDFSVPTLVHVTTGQATRSRIAEVSPASSTGPAPRLAIRAPTSPNAGSTWS